MDNLDDAALKELLLTKAKPQVTIYIPTHSTTSSPHMTENQIRFKNLMHEAANQVRSQNARLASHLELQAGLLKDDFDFWETQTAGLLICAADGNIQMFHLPIDTEEYVSVDDHFHLAPIMGIMHDEKPYYLLELSQQNPKLLIGNMYGLRPSDIDLPANIKEALNIDELSQKGELQGAAGGFGDTGRFNGRGGSKDQQEEDRIRFFRLVDKVISRAANSSLPMVLAGIESEAVEYKQISRYPTILKAIVGNNHDNDGKRHMSEAASRIVWQELVLPEHKSALEEYLRVGGANPERVAHDTHSISQAAQQGRIDKLLTRLTRRTSDTVRDQSQDVPRITFPEAKESKTLNDIAVSVWQSRGTIFNLLPNEMPDGVLMAARLRY